MPVYGSGTPATLAPGWPSVVWNDENVPTTGAAQYSVPVSLKRQATMPNCLAVELAFAANPGAFSVEVQFADTDADKYYVTRAPAYTSGLSAGFVGRIEYTSIVAKFARLKMVTLTNAVKVTAKMF